MPELADRNRGETRRKRIACGKHADGRAAAHCVSAFIVKISRPMMALGMNPSLKDSARRLGLSGFRCNL